MFDGKSLADVELKLKGAFDFHRLHANDGLWSFGEQRPLVFDGSRWHRML